MQDRRHTQEDLIATKSKALASILSMQGVTLIYNALQIAFSLILVRLLEPKHFGLFAPVFAIFNFFAITILMGQSPLFIRKKDYPAGHFIQLIAINAIIAFAIIESASGIFSFIDPQAPQMTRILFLALLPSSVNMGFTHLATRRLERYKLFPAWMLDIISFGLSAVFFALNNYGAYSFVYAIVISRVLFFIYVFFIYRVEILSSHLIRMGQYFNYMREGFIFNISFLSGALSEHGDRVILTRFIPLGKLGLYSVAVKYANIFNNFILNTMEVIAYPLYAKFIDDFKRTERIYYSFTALTFALLIPLNSFVFVFSRDIIRIVAGERWIGAAGLISIFSFLYLTKFVRYFGYQILWASKKEAINLIQVATRTVLFLSIGVTLSFKYSLYGFIIAYFVQGIYDSVFYYFVLKGLKRQILKNMRFIISIFIPVFVLLNIIGAISNFYVGILTMLTIYLVFARYIFIPFIEKEFGLRIKDFIPALIKKGIFKKR